MIHYKEFNSLEDLNKFNDENDIRVISIYKETIDSCDEFNCIGISEVCLKVWYEGGWKKSNYGCSES